MRFRNLIYLTSIVLVTLLASCKKDGFNPLSDVRPDVPVTVANVYDYRPSPTVKASKAENKITITLSIPAASGRTIKEISKVATGATANYTNIQSSTVGVNGLYSNTPIPGTGTSVTFSTTFDDYKTKTATATLPASNSLLGRDFYFSIVLDNGQVIIPTNVRVWLVD